MKIGVLKPHTQGERRVPATPESVKRLTDAGHQVIIQTQAGLNAGFTDQQYSDAKATIKQNRHQITESIDLLLCVAKPSDQDIESLQSGAVVIGVLDARNDKNGIERLAEAGINALAMELVPRIARAQSMDVLSSQASLAGYKAAIIAANSIGKFFPMMMTAAGTIPPAQVLILGAGVAGLQAIATAKRLGAIVQAFDVRAAAAEQVESLGATFISQEINQDAETKGGYARAQTDEENQAQRTFLTQHIARADIVITTAAIPGRKAPMLVTNEMLNQMKQGSVIVDLAAETGGNVQATQAGKTINFNGVEIHGPINIPSSMPYHASQMYSRNLEALLKLITNEQLNITLDFEDEVIDAMCVTHDGTIRTHTIN